MLFRYLSLFPIRILSLLLSTPGRFLLPALFLCLPLTAQVESVGRPLGRSLVQLRSVLTIPTTRLPYFDRDSALVALQRQSSTRLYAFAHKEKVDIDLIRQGEHHFVEGKELWLYRVRSAGALTLSFLFDRCRLPEGALIYIYGTKGGAQIGGFSPECVSPSGFLPTRPLPGDDVIIECQVPKGSPRPDLHLTEVNHGLRSLFLLEGPQFVPPILSQLTCSPDVVCFPELEQSSRAVCLVCVNGTALGTGALINTVSTEGLYVLTAAHVYTMNFSTKGEWANRERLAETMVFFFNYKSPLCSGEVMPQVNQSAAGAALVGLDERSDITLVKLHHTLPDSYKGYALGWDMTENPMPPYYNIHHPRLHPMRLNVSNTPLEQGSFTESGLPIAPDRHWILQGWDVGTTASGSSGSPLLDAHKRLIGGLTGGTSTCRSPGSPDQFFRLNALLRHPSEGAARILSVLNPGGKHTVWDGKELSPLSQTLLRITHIKGLSYSDPIEDKSLSSEDTRKLLSDRSSEEIGERYLLHKGTRIHGFYTILRNLSGDLSPDTRIRYRVYQGVENRLVEQGVLPLTKMQRYIPSSASMGEIVRPSASVMEVYTELSTPLEMRQEGSLVFTLEVDDLGSTLLPLIQQGTGIPGLLFRKGDAWDESPHKASMSMWIDPLVEVQGAQVQERSLPLMEIKSLEASSISVLLRPEDPATETEIIIYNLLGQVVMRKVTTHPLVTIPRKRLAGLGVLIIHARNGSQEISQKIFVPAY